jgi:hypothetical protein
MSTNHFFSGRTLMKLLLIPLVALFIGAPSLGLPQKNKSVPAPGPMLTRTFSRHEVRRFGFGGTVTVVGAPQGSITIQGWSRNEVEITADIELHAETEEDLARLAGVNVFGLDDDVNHLSVLTTGTHDKSYMRRVAKDFPKRLLALPWKIDYHLRVPASTDLEIHAGAGPISLNGVEGGIVLTSPQTDATLTLTGGAIMATVASGTVNVRIPTRSWRGSGAYIQLASGQLNVELPVGFSGDIDADILRSGKIENTYPGIEDRERSGLSEKMIRGRAGAGGAMLKFTVGAGTIVIKKAVVN